MSDVVGVGVPTTRNNEIVKFGIIFARLVAYAVFQNKYIYYVIKNNVKRCRGRRPRQPEKINKNNLKHCRGRHFCMPL